MHKYTYILVTIFAVVLAGCGGSDDGGGSASTAAESAAPSMAESAAPAATPAESGAGKATPMSAGDKTMYVDHSKDEMEFQLKHSIDGWTSLLEDVSDGDEVSKIKEHIAGLQSKLNSL